MKSCNFPKKIAQKKGCNIVVYIDEFQQIAEFKDSKTFQKRLRSVWQLQKSVSYCLFGSKKHLMNELFEKQTESLTTYQMNFLRAVIDGIHCEFTKQEVLQKYRLGSSANVSIVKRALVKKELVEIEKRQVIIPDPVMAVWLKWRVR